MGGMFSRTPHDLELNLDSGPRFAKMFRKQATAAGFKEGVDYKINGTTNIKKRHMRSQKE
jgi:hypothetical protein